MSQSYDRIAQLENEVLSLKKQLAHTQENIPEQALNSLFAHGREVVFYVANDERLTVIQISDSISTYGYSPVDFTSGGIGWRDVLYPQDIESFSAYVAAECAKGAVSMESEYRIRAKSGEVIWVTGVAVPETNDQGEVAYFWVKVKDISRRKRYEEDLQDANENLFVTLKSIGEAVILTGTDGSIERLNGAAERLVGIINLKARGKHLGDIMQFCDNADFAAPVDPLKLEAETCKMVQVDEIFMRCGDNSRVYRVSCNVSPIVIGKNKTAPDSYVLVVKDLTAVYDALQAAQESEARLQESESTIRGIFDHSADGMLLADHNGVVREWSSGYERISGLTKEEAVGNLLWDVAATGFLPEQRYGEERRKMDDTLKELVGNMRLKMITHHVVHRKTGEHRILNIQYFPVAMPGRTMLGAIGRDVTEEVYAQELISRNEQKLTLERDRLKTLGDNMPNGCLYQFTLNTQTRQMGFTYMSRAWKEITGIAHDAAIMTDLNRLLAGIHPDDLPVYMERFEQSLATMGRFMVEVRFMINASEVRWGRISSTPHMEGANVVWDGFIVDITDYKQAEQKLTAEKDRLQALGDHFPNGCLFRFGVDGENRKISFSYLSKTWERLTGLGIEETLNDINIPLSKLHPDDRAALIDRIWKTYASREENFDMELRYYSTPDELRWAQVSTHRHLENGRMVSDGFILDITARKAAEEELRSEKERLQALGDNFPDGTLFRFKMDLQTEEMSFDYISGTWEKTVGVSAEASLADIRTLFEYVVPDDLPHLMTRIRESVERLENIDVEVRCLHPVRGLRWYQISSHPHRESHTVFSDGFILDITPRKTAEEELRSEKERLQALGDNFPDGTLFRFKMDLQTGEMSFDYVSGTWEKTVGVSAEASLADIRVLFEYVVPDDLPLLMTRIRESVERLENIDVEVRFRHEAFGLRWCQISSHPHREGHIVFSDGFILDITARKVAEEKVHSEKERLEALGNNIPGGTLFRFQINAGLLAQSDAATWMQHLKLSYASGTWEKVSNIPLDDALRDVSLPFMKIDAEDLARIIPAMRESLTDLTELNTEIRYHYSDTEMRWFQVASVPRREDEWITTDGFLLDITERKKTEEELAGYRVELELMVKERTEELEATNEELYATNEELYATNEEFSVTNEELHSKNDQLRNEIAARMEVMRKLEDSENKMSNFIRQSFEGIMMLDEQGCVIEWNEALENITGISHDEALGRYEWDLMKKYLSDEERRHQPFEKMRQLRKAYLEGGREQAPAVEELVLHMPDGSKRYMQVSMFPIGLATTCCFGRIFRDITEQKMADMELEQYRTQLEQMVELKTRELVASQERLISLSNNLPGGVIYQMMDRSMVNSWFTYISGYFSDMFEIRVEDVMADVSLYYKSIYPEDRPQLIEFYRRDENNIDVEYRIITRSGKLKWIHMRSSHRSSDGARIWDGFMIDVTARKQAEQELENTRRQQSVLIKVLQIVQSSESLPEAMSASLAEMGKYAGVSRAYIFEKCADASVNNTYEWCNEGIAPAIDELQNVPAEYVQSWFDTFDSGKYIRTSDINTLEEKPAELLRSQGVKSIAVFPLSANGVNHGFVGFDDCIESREWEQSEIDLLISLSQIISSTTRRHQAETAMRLSQQTMRTVLDNIDANIYVADFESHEVFFANKKVKETMGDNIEGKVCWKVLQENQNAQCDFCPNPRLRDSQGHPTGLYHWEQWNTNTKKWYDSTDAAIEWVDGRLVHMEYATDITDRKKAEEAVRQSEELYRQLTVASPDAIAVCSPDGQLRYMSPKAFELFRVEEDADVSLLRLLKFVHPHDRRHAYSMFHRMNTDNVTFLPQLLLMRRDGSDFIGEISVATVKDSDGRTTSMIMVIRDITRRKMDEMELIRAKEKAEESDKLKSAFLANMSHEIRTPINGIIGFLHFLGSDSLSPKRRQDYINIINNSSIQLVKLIDDIIDVAKIEAKQMNIRPVPIRINELMGELQVFFETYVHANDKERIALIFDDSQAIDSCVAYVDPTRLRQVLNNLIGNAVKFTEKGFIRIAYRQSAPDQLEFVVEDSGIGLAPDQVEVVFERFRQAELSNSRQYGGTGLGLTISRSLVQLMGGEMWVESTEGSGSSFYFTISYLPVAAGDEPVFEEAPEDESPKDRSLGNKSVLVVEPNPMKFKYYEKLISATGANVTQAETLQQWLDYIAQTNHIDTVIADVSVLKDEDIDSIRRIKHVRAGLPVVLIIPGQKEDYRQVICDSQCNTAVEIPIDAAEIEQVLKRYAR
ncbi:MAG: PAS domain S-box protein [Bacteroidales bacterium]|jgi:PAS domain S-box-containing protein|nr:PAS domain S-box protein [Bacteroidales bacterium]